MTNQLKQGVLFLLLAFTTYLALGQSRTITEQAKVTFSTRTTDGHFGRLEGEIVFAIDQPEAAKVRLSVPVSSIETGIDLKNKHARGKDWFEADRYPMIVFESDTITPSPSGWQVTGTLSMHGISREIVVPFSIKKEPHQEVFTGSFTVNRLDYGIGSGLRSWVVGEDISINFTIPTLLTR